MLSHSSDSWSSEDPSHEGPAAKLSTPWTAQHGEVTSDDRLGPGAPGKRSTSVVRFADGSGELLGVPRAGTRWRSVEHAGYRKPRPEPWASGPLCQSGASVRIIRPVRGLGPNDVDLRGIRTP